VSKSRRQKQKNFKRRIENRLRPRNWRAQAEPMFSASNIHYELTERSRGLGAGGIGAMMKMARVTGLVEELDRQVEVLKVHLPYQESDHVLNIAFNILCGGTCLEDIELLRNNESYLNAVGAQRIPDPTTAGDFLRRFEEKDIDALMSALNETRVRVWKVQGEEFFEEAKIDVDGSLIETTGECKEGMDISYKGGWGYHALVVSLANTGEPLYVVNRSGNRPSHEGAARRLDEAIQLCRGAGFKKVTLRGDTDFSQTEHLDRWDSDDVGFVFGIDSMSNLRTIAKTLPTTAWKPLVRRPKYEVVTEPRERPDNVKERIVVEREFKNIRLVSEEVAEFPYSPRKCNKTYRIVVVRKNLSIEKGEKMLFDEIRYLFYLTNNEEASATEIVYEANDRCNQENLLSQLKSGVQALKAPVDNLLSNWAYMVTASLAWSLKAWFALLLPERGRWREKYLADKQDVLRMEFKKFVNVFMLMPAQIIRQGRRLIYRFLSWNPWQAIFFRAVDNFQTLRC